MRLVKSHLLFLLPVLSLACGGVDNLSESPTNEAESELTEEREEGALAFDTDDDGKIAKAEFLRGHAARFDEADANKDAKIGGDELMNLHPKHRGGRGGPDGEGKMKGSKEGMMRMDPKERFAKTDANKDGAIDQSEVTTEVTAHFAELDKNADGKLSADEAPHRGHRGGRGGPDGEAEETSDLTKEAFIAKAWSRVSRADADKDGKVTEAELIANGPFGKGGPDGKRGGPDGKGPMAKMDTDKDGALSKTEWATMGEEMWKKIDADGDGFALPSEMHPKGHRGPRPTGE